MEQENDPKEGFKSITGRWGRNETNSSQRSGEVLCNGFATEQGSMPNREVCSTVKSFFRWHSGSPLCCGLLGLDRVSCREYVSPGSPALERKHTRRAPASLSTSSFCDQKEKKNKTEHRGKAGFKTKQLIKKKIKQQQGNGTFQQSTKLLDSQSNPYITGRKKQRCFFTTLNFSDESCLSWETGIPVYFHALWKKTRTRRKEIVPPTLRNAKGPKNPS